MNAHHRPVAAGAPDQTSTPTAETGVQAEELMVACVDGPMAGQWYTHTDWHERRTAAQRMSDRGQQPTAVSGYIPTGPSVRHPHHGQDRGAAWHYQPTSQLGPHQITVPPGTVLTVQEVADLVADGVVAIIPTPDTHDSVPGAEVGEVGAPFRVLVTGSRAWCRVRDITTALDQVRAGLAPGQGMRVVHGGCPRGADAIAEAWAARHHHDPSISVERHRADWDTHGRQAGILRNTAMVQAGADVCLAFIRDDSPGATHCARTATGAGIRTDQYTHTGDADTITTHHPAPVPTAGDDDLLGIGDHADTGVDEDGWSL